MAKKMKSSGVDWIGDIPEKWDVCKIINCLSSIGSGTTPQGQEYYENEYIPWLNTGDLNDGYIEKTEKSVSEKALSDYSVLKRFDAGSVVVAMYGATVGKLGIVTSSLVTNQACCVMTSNEKLYNKFLFYLFMAGKTYLISLSLGSGQPNINQNTVKTFDIPFVPLSEQKAIADYLDDRCGKIDDFIAKQKAVIEKLKEYKQSVITEAVTKGLNPATPMKSSGVDWIGDIPEKWDVRKLFQVFTQVKNKNQGMTETNLLSLSYGKIKQKNIETSFGLLPESFETYNIIEKNDIVLRLTDLQNDQKSVRVGLSTQRGIITSAYVTMRAKDSRMAPYLYYLLHTFDIEKGFYGMGDGVRQGLNWDELKKLLSLVLPPLSEQKEIADYLDAKCAEIDAFIAKKQTVIDKLTEYKKSLIYEYVTGKQEA